MWIKAVAGRYLGGSLGWYEVQVGVVSRRGVWRGYGGSPLVARVWRGPLRVGGRDGEGLEVLGRFPSARVDAHGFIEDVPASWAVFGE